MNDQEIDRLIDFVIKNAFEGLSNTNPLSVEVSIRIWMKIYNAEKHKEKKDPSCCGRSMEPTFGDRDGYFCNNCAEWTPRFRD